MWRARARRGGSALKTRRCAHNSSSRRPPPPRMSSRTTAPRSLPLLSRSRAMPTSRRTPKRCGTTSTQNSCTRTRSSPSFDSCCASSKMASRRRIRTRRRTGQISGLVVYKLAGRNGGRAAALGFASRRQCIPPGTRARCAAALPPADYAAARGRSCISKLSWFSGSSKEMDDRAVSCSSTSSRCRARGPRAGRQAVERSPRRVG